MYKYRYQNVQSVIYITRKICKFFHIVLVMSIFDLIWLIFMLYFWDKPFITHFYRFTVIIISSVSPLLIGWHDFVKMDHQVGTIKYFFLVRVDKLMLYCLQFEIMSMNIYFHIFLSSYKLCQSYMVVQFNCCEKNCYIKKIP